MFLHVLFATILAFCVREQTAYDNGTQLCLDIDSDFADSSGISLLQRTAKATKANHIQAAPPTSDTILIQRSVHADVNTHVALGSDANAKNHHASTPVPPVMAQASWAFTAKQAVIVVFGFVAVGIFFFTEGQAESAEKSDLSEEAFAISSSLHKATGGEDGRQIAKALPSKKPSDVQEQVLQDFIPDIDEPWLISVDGREPVTFKKLRAFIQSVDADVSRFGITVTDRLAVILGDGPEAVVAFWAFSAQCAFCPINMKATHDEVAFTLKDLPAKAVVLLEGKGPFQGFPTIRCTPNPCFAGLFTLSGNEKPTFRVKPSRMCHALVIQTSGTTKKPKQVPLTHQNLILCNQTIVEMIQLTKSDRALNFLPLFHIGGISNNIISPVLSRSSVVCGTHFVADDVFNWILEHRPTWYFGSPTTHMLLMREHQPPAEEVLRLIRNATAALLPSTAQDMGQFWKNCQILPGYGMSECTPIASHQYEKHVRLASSGPQAGPHLKVDPKGEILVKGPAVFAGYEVREHMDENPNALAVQDGWFHTGDAGSMDKDGYLSITGRFKEIIIRGGENISPFHVEDAFADARLSAHMAFSISHEELGEVVGIAVETGVHEDDLGILFKSLKEKSNLEHNKLPEVIVKVDDIPKGLAGKLKRIGFAEKIGLPSRSITRPSPIAYVYMKQKLTALDIVDDAEMVELDSLGLAKSRGGASIPPEVKNGVMCVYAIVAFSVVSYHTMHYLDLDSDPAIGNLLVVMSGLNVAGGVRWTMQAFMACASFLNCKEPFQVTRVIVLAFVYFGLEWPLGAAIAGINYFISQEPMGSWYVNTTKRWFVSVMICSYVLFAGTRNLPCKGLQCIALATLTLCLMITNPNEDAWTDVAPAWMNFWFMTDGVCGWFVWTGCATVYFTVGHYGHEALARIRAHPLANRPRFMQKFSIACTLLFFIFEVLLFSGQEAITAYYLDAKALNGFIWTQPTAILDQLVGIVMICLLAGSVRNGPTWLAFVGSNALGIYLGCGLIFYTSPPITQNTITNYAAVTPTIASPAFIVDRIPIFPPLQDALVTLRSFWPAEVLVFLAYVVWQIALIGIPVHQVYLQFVALVDAMVRKGLGMVDGSGTSSPILAMGCAAMLVFGTMNVVMKDWQVKLDFYEPYLWSLVTFVGQSFFLPIYWLKQRRIGNGDKTPEFAMGAKPPAPLHVYALVTFFDYTALCLINIAYAGLPGSICQMLKALKLVFTTFLSVTVLGKSLRGHNYLGISLNIVGVALVAYVAVSGATGWSSGSNAVRSLIIGCASCLVGSFQFIWEEKTMRQYAVEPELLTGMEGVIGVCYATIVLFIVAVLHVEDLPVAFAELWHKKIVLCAFLLFLLAVASYNYASLIVTRHSSAMVRSLLDVGRTATVWLVEIWCTWDRFSWLELLGFLVMAYGTMVYGKILRAPCLADDK